MTSLNPVTTVGDQVLEAIQLHARTSRDEARARVMELFAHGRHPRSQRAASRPIRTSSPAGSSSA